MTARTRSVVMCAAVLAASGFALAAGNAGRKAAEEKERQLVGVLQSDAPPQDKAIPCKQLAIYGGRAAVPVLAALLSNRELASWARTALEAIPDPAADDALRQAMGRLQGRLLIGAINSIGVRRDAKAVEPLVGKLKDADADVASAAAAALGRIGGEQAAKALEQALAATPAAVRSAVAEGCILCAERYLAEGKAEQAVRLFEAVRKADVPRQRMVEATRGAILARGSAGVPLLVEQLRSADKAMFRVGLRTARELPGPEATEAVMAELGRATEDRKAMLLLALADRGDAKALPAMLEAARTGGGPVRIAAIGVLERLGDVSCLPVLLDSALDADADVARLAKAALARLSGPKVDADILARLGQSSGRMRQVLVELAGQRQIAAALPAILRSAEDGDAAVRSAAVAAIGALGGDKQAADLVAILQKTQDPQEQEGIEKALMALSVRGGAACVRHLMPLARSDKGALRVIGLHALACAGGPDALAALKSALDDKDQTVRDEAVRTLSTWPNRWPEDAAAAEHLLALARSAKEVAHQVLAMRGYLQHVQGTRKLRDDGRLARLREVLPLIARPEEKRLAVSVLGTIRTAGALEMLVGFAGDAGVAEEACSAIVGLAGGKDAAGIPKEDRRKALQAAAEKSKSAGTRRRAQEALKALN